MAHSRFGRRTSTWIARVLPAVFCLAMARDATAQNPQAEQSYKQFVAVYQGKSTPAELQNARSFLETANRLAPNTYKYVYSLGALNSALARWEDASRWFEKAQTLARTAEEKARVRTEFDYCQTQIAKARVRAWGGPGILISFIMKDGTAEMDQVAIDKLPQRLPVVKVGDSPQPIENALRQTLGSINLGLLAKEIFLIAGVQDGTPLETHYDKGIKDFYNYFKAEYFEQAPQRRIVVLISSQPYPLVEATRRFYPEVRIPVYAPFLGYYNPADNLIMATGGSAGYGTLLHEMMHALINADFPKAPPWLNEGIASLYERTQWREGRLNALPNWRLDRMREEDIHSLQELGRTAGDIGLHSNQIGEIRLFLLFLDKEHQVNALYRMAKQKGSAFSLEDAIRDFGLKEADWRSFVKNVFRDYRAEVSIGQDALSNPEDVRFVQLALNHILGVTMKVDGLWGPSTHEKLVDFQKRYGLDPDGLAGAKTMAELRRQYSLGQMKAMELAR